jgi:CRISPR/Cas system-associated exonuclease Cas4 (RecB family)
LQLPLYKYIFERETGFAVSACGIYGIKKAEITVFPGTAEIYGMCMDAVSAVLDEINTGESFEFDEQDRPDCRRCRYFYICR